ncbi:fructosamine kinase family protein [Vibrio salinus]|uniref:fructosamine kinase family protein n=1 Tax=Vibrio salinus TaxID=2899784 RepID=UPI001E4A0D2D|nr:fructosamine kinase family protein [Vibrio salinus]MCE0492517.1 fructosamine kinase family protein [Vibrio salinus]
MWDSIANHISHETKQNFVITKHHAISGGDINKSYFISDGLVDYFVKVNNKNAIDLFISEAENLNRLRQSDTISVPEVITYGTTKSHSFLTLKYSEISVLTNDDTCYLAGKQLAKLHLWDDQKEFGFDHDNFIGLTEQPNAWNKNWARFYSEQRIGWQLQLLKDKGIVLTDISDFVHHIYHILAGHNPKPSLLHGDLWSGNLGSTKSGPLFYDPACYWGDRECDIAMSRLFGHFPQSFYKGYNDIYPLPDSYQKRADVYNLYHILNHCNCFGGSYLSQAEKMIEVMK